MPGFLSSVRYLMLVTTLVSCAGSMRGPSRLDRSALTGKVTASNYSSFLRVYFLLDKKDSERQRLRDELLQFLTQRAQPHIRTANYDEAVKDFAAMTSLFSSDELASSNLAKSMAPIARFIRETGAQRGDEARTLAALYILRRLHSGSESARFQTDYTTLRQWGYEARTKLGGLSEGYDSLIRVWDEHARLTPAPSVLNELASLYIKRLTNLVQQIKSTNDQKRESAFTFQQYRESVQAVTRTPFDLAGLFLKVDDYARASKEIAKLREFAGEEQHLARAIDEAGAKKNPDALAALIKAYVERGYVDVTQALCRYGKRVMDTDSRFSVCLARLAAAESDYGGATAWYADATRRAPTNRSLYNEALNTLNVLIEQKVFETDPTEARRVGMEAEKILHEYKRRWPQQKPPIDIDKINLILAQAEMNAGNVVEARKRLNESLAVQKTPEALLQLGTLEERIGNDDKAIELYTKALKFTSRKTDSSIAARAELLERLGDAHRKKGAPSKAAALYTQALDLWRQLRDSAKGPALSIVLLRSGVISDRLGQHDKAITYLKGSLMAAPSWREAYAQVLSYLTSAQKPDYAFATSIFRQSLTQLTLDPEWKVYFALWLKFLAHRAGTTLDSDIGGVLEDMSSGEPWWGWLARFGANKINYAQLLSRASNLGEQTEAHFYEGTRLLAQKNASQACGLFRRVLKTNMVGFYEFMMAQELLAVEAKSCLP